MRISLLAASLFLVMPRPAAAQRWTLSDSVRRSVDDVFSFVEREAPGCALGVVRDGRLAYGRGYGVANLDWGIPLTTSTVFDIGSVSKQFTATALALLEIDGVLSLDDDVRRWVPELPAYGGTITIRHLLNHTSGIRDYLTLMDLAGFQWANTFDELDGVELITRQRALNFEPGSEYLYSNSGYLLLANIVRRATGSSLREFLEARVFDPLGMAHTSVWDDNTEVLAERATGYSPAEEGGWDIDHAWNFQMGGDGQVITSIEDLVKWDANFYDPLVGGRALLDRLHTRGVLNSGDTIAYALGLSIDAYRGLPRVQHGGAWAGFRAMLARFPGERTSILVACNRGDADTGTYADAVADAVLAGRFPEAAGSAEAGAGKGGEPPALTLDQLRRWVGLYRHRDRPRYVRFDVVDDRLAVVDGDDVHPLSPRSASEFTLEVSGQRVIFSRESGSDGVRLGSNRYTRVDGVSPDSPALDAYVGSYRSPELDARFEVRRTDGGVRLVRPNRDPSAMVPGIADEFEAGGLGLTFVRAAGRIVGLRVFAGRVTGIVFDREQP